MNKKIILGYFCILTFAYTVFHYSYHNSIHTHSLSQESLQEEGLFSEGAFYYSFYKDFVNSPNTLTALTNYFKNSNYEAPNAINPHQRFNLTLELLSGLGYRLLANLGIDMSPMKFYNIISYSLNGLSLFFVLLIAHLLTRNLWLSLVPLCLFFTQFEFLTRMVTNTPLRENAGISLLLAHVFFTLLFLKTDSFSNKLQDNISLKKIFTTPNIGFILSLFTQLIFWQFTQFTLIVNILAVAALFLFNHINHSKLLD